MIKFLKPLLLGICCFLLGYAVAQKITPQDLRARFRTNETASQTQNAQQPQQRQQSQQLPLLTLRIERDTESGEVNPTSAVPQNEGLGAVSDLSGASSPETAPQVPREAGTEGSGSAPENIAVSSSSTAPSLPGEISISGAVSQKENAVVPQTENAAASASRGGENFPPAVVQNGEVDAVSALSGEEILSQNKDGSPASTVPSHPAAISPTGEVSGDVVLPKLALVIDDLGYSTEFAQRILQLDIPITWTIIPEAGQSRRIAALAEAHGQPYLVHIPMQAIIDKMGSPEYIIGVDTTEEKIRAYLDDLQKKFPTACGVSNHRGSRATSDIETMLRFMKALAATGWPFLDSRTTGKTTATHAALEYGIPILQNCVFIDGNPDIATMQKKFAQALHVAQQQGVAVAICHAREATLPFLKSLRQKQFPHVTFVTVDQLWQEGEATAPK